MLGREDKTQKGKGSLTEDFEHSGGISNPSRTSCDLTVEDELIRRLNRGDGQTEVLSNGDTPAQGGSNITFALSTLGSESYSHPGSLLLFLDDKKTNE